MENRWGCGQVPGWRGLSLLPEHAGTQTCRHIQPVEAGLGLLADRRFFSGGPAKYVFIQKLNLQNQKSPSLT